MKTYLLTKNPVMLSALIVATFTLTGCGSSGGYDEYSYESQDHKLERAAREDMYDATDSMSDQELRDLEKNLRKSQ